MESRKMRIGIVGCGFTGDRYFPSIKLYPELELAGATDRDSERAAQFCNHFAINLYPTLESMLADPGVEMIVNLTSSTSHFEVSKAALEAGKHVYSEKPMAPDFDQAKALVDLAAAKGLYLGSAPSSLLGETAQTLWRALRKKEIGPVRLVYAELDDGPLHLMEPHTWRSPSGARYDYQEELSAGVTAEHACYYLAWLVAYFGPAKTITAFSSCLWPVRPVHPGETLENTTADFSVACITFESGVVARLTCGLIAPHSHVMKIVGDTGVLTVNECWNFSAPVYLDRYSIFKFKAEAYPITRSFPFLATVRDRGSRIYPPVRKASLKNRYHRYRLDFARGIVDLSRAIRGQRSPLLPIDFCLHVNELCVAIQNPPSTPYQVKTSFKALQPLDDAALNELIAPGW